MSFGESALLDEQVRTADVVVDEPAEIAVLALADLDALIERTPDLSAQMYRNVAQMLAARLKSANSQLRALD
jgi:CRP-like cAMP-binding protein